MVQQITVQERTKNSLLSPPWDLEFFSLKTRAFHKLLGFGVSLSLSLSGIKAVLVTARLSLREILLQSRAWSWGPPPSWFDIGFGAGQTWRDGNEGNCVRLEAAVVFFSNLGDLWCPRILQKVAKGSGIHPPGKDFAHALHCGSHYHSGCRC